MKFIDLTGKSFGRLTVVNQVEKYRSPSGGYDRKWLCSCLCGKKCIVFGSNLRTKHTVSCGCLDIEKSANRWKNNKIGKNKIKGTKNIRLVYFNRMKQNSIKRNLDFSISIEFMQELLEKQNFKCALTGVPIEMELVNPSTLYYFNRRKNKKLQKDVKLNTASLDRIDSKKGYTIDNVQWVHKDINFLKMNFPEIEFFDWCKKVVIYKNLI